MIAGLTHHYISVIGDGETERVGDLAGIESLAAERRKDAPVGRKLPYPIVGRGNPKVVVRIHLNVTDPDAVSIGLSRDGPR